MTIKAEINPDVLVWARKTSGMTLEQSAKKIGTTPDRLYTWEEGEDFPTLRQLRLIGKTYKRPSAFFYLQEPPALPKEIVDFRKTPDALEGKSPQLIYEIRLAKDRRETALDLTYQLFDSPVEFKVLFKKKDGVKKIAEKLREEIGISITEQASWKEQYKALRSWINAIEKLGVLVTQFSKVEVSEARGFTIAERPLPLIAINAKDKPRGRIFTLIHELVHIAINEGGLCDLHDHHDFEGDVEPFINSVAAEIIVPSTSLLSQEVVAENKSMEWSDEDLQKLSKYYQASEEVILRRLLSLERTTNEFYRQRRKVFLKRYSRIKGGGFIRYHKKILRDNGYTYTTLLLNAYQNKKISVTELLRSLGNIKYKHCSSIEYDLGLSV